MDQDSPSCVGIVPASKAQPWHRSLYSVNMDPDLHGECRGGKNRHKLQTGKGAA